MIIIFFLILPGLCCAFNDYDLYYKMNGGVNWDNFRVVLDPTVTGMHYGTEDSIAIVAPSVIRQGDHYRMWYHGYQVVGTQYTFYCESGDGKNWYNFRLVLNPAGAPGSTCQGVYDTQQCVNPSVITEGSLYVMYYNGNDGASYRIIRCESDDGISWRNFQLVINTGSMPGYDDTDCIGPNVIKDSGRYKMWYRGSPYNGIISCESNDGINWSNFRLSIPPGSLGTYDINLATASTAIKDYDSYKIWYVGQDALSTYRIIYAESGNGINWSEFRLSINVNAIGVVDTTNVQGPCVINDGGTGKIWYTVHDGVNLRIVYAESR